MPSKPLTSLTIVAAAIMIATIAWRVFHLPTVYLFAVLLLSWGSVLFFFSRTLPRDSSPLTFWWSWRGALLWLGCILVATGTVYAIKATTDNPMTWEQWSQQMLGFTLAYILGFALYQGVRWYSRR